MMPFAHRELPYIESVIWLAMLPANWTGVRHDAWWRMTGFAGSLIVYRLSFRHANDHPDIADGDLRAS